MKKSNVLIGSNRDLKLSSAKKLCIKDENGRIFHVQSLNIVSDAGKACGEFMNAVAFYFDDVEPSQLNFCPDGKGGLDLGAATAVNDATLADAVSDRRRKPKKRRLKNETVPEERVEAKDGVEGYDPLTGEVLGPEGQPIGPGNGSVVVRDINSEKVLILDILDSFVSDYAI